MSNSAPTKQAIHSDAAPPAVGTYSQAMRAGHMLYLSGQIPLDPVSGALITGDVEQQIVRIFDNITAILTAASANFSQIVKLNVYLTNINHFGLVNSVMTRYFMEPYPARAVIEVSALPKGAEVEIEVIAMLDGVF